MGAEARCTLRLGGRFVEGRVLLETDALIFRGDVRLTIPLKELTVVEAADGWLRVAHSGGEAAFELGPKAEPWARKILNPLGLLDKLGVKRGMRVSMLGIADADFRQSLLQRGAEVYDQAEPASELIFLAVERRDDLEQLGSLLPSLKADGAIWTVRPKGAPQVTEADVLAAGRAAGLVDTKVVRFSETHTAEKFVIPKGRR